MFGKLKLGVKLIIYMSVMLVTTMTLISYITFNASKKELLESISTKLQLINRLKKEKIDAYFSNIESSFEYLQKTQSIHHLFEEQQNQTQNGNTSSQQGRTIEELHKNLKNIEESYNFNRILLLNTRGEIIHATSDVPQLKKQDLENFAPNSRFLISSRADLTYSEIYHPTLRKNKYYLMAASPIKNEQNTTIGIVACELNINPLFEVITDNTGLGATGETFLTVNEKNKVRFISPLKYTSSQFVDNAIVLGEPFGIPAQESVNKNNVGFATEILDYNKVAVDASWDFIPQFGWGIVTKINHEDSFKSILYLRVLITFLCCMIIFFAIIFIAIFVMRFLKPIIDIRNNMMQLANGYFPDYIEYENEDEIKETTHAMNELVTRLKHSTEFAQKIGKGDLNVKFEYAQGEDVLSRALITMRENLARIESENDRRKWATEGIALHGEIVRNNSTTLETLCETFISILTEYVGAQHGGIYSIDQISNSKNQLPTANDASTFTLIAKYAYDFPLNTESSQRTYKLGQGLIGQCALEKELIYIKDKKIAISQISSGLGTAPAVHVLFTPLLVNDQIMGVIELAAFSPFEEYKIEFIKKVSESIASAILSLKSAEQTKTLLSNSREITSSLKKEEEKLKQELIVKEQEIQNLKEDYQVAQNIIKKLENDKNS